MNEPAVTVREITGTEELLSYTADPSKPKMVDFGSAKINAGIQMLRKNMREQQERAFLLTWNGSRVPRGAVVMGHEIAWTQHGMVNDKDGKMIGTYDRIVDKSVTNENAAPSQIMLVFMQTKQLTAGQ